MAHYLFTTTWRFKAPLQKIWLIIYDYPRLPSWWKSVKKVEVIKLVKSNRGQGSIFDCVWQGVIPYSLHFQIEVTEVIPGKRIRGRATGDLEGWGTWVFMEEYDGVVVTYIWDVETKKSWMNQVAPVARPIFHWAHNQIMNQGEQGLQRLLARSANHPKAKVHQ